MTDVDAAAYPPAGLAVGAVGAARPRDGWARGQGAGDAGLSRVGGPDAGVRRAPLLLTPTQISEWAQAAAAVLALLYGIFGPLGKRYRAWRLRREERERTIRYLADAVHVLLRERVRRTMPDGDLFIPTDDDLAQQAVRVYEQRNALFRADGHEPPKRSTQERPLTQAEVLVLIRRTQAIQEMKQRTPESHE